MARNVPLSSIRSKLILAFLTAFIPLAVLHFIAYCRHYDSRKELIYETHSSLANSIASAVTTFVEGIVSSHDAVARTIEHGAGRKTLARYLSSICAAHPGMVSCSIISTDRELLCAYPEGSVPANVATELGVRRVLNGSPVSVDSLYDSNRVDYAFAVSSLVTPQNGNPVVVRSVIKTESILGLMPLQELYDDCIVILDSDGRAVCRSLPARKMPFEKNWKAYDFVDKVLRGHDTPVYSLRLSKHVEVMGHAAPIRKFRWAAVVLDTEDKIMAPIRDDQTWLFSSILVAGLGLVWIVSVGNRITNPLRRLSRGAAALSVGDLRRRIEIHTGDELESLAESFNKMGESLELHEIEITDKTAALEGLFSLAQALMSSMDLDEILKSLVALTTNIMHSQACAIFLADESGKLTVRESYNLSSEFRQTLSFNPGEGCPGEAVENRHWTACRNIETDGDLASRERALSEGLAGVLSVPLITGGSAFGALSVWTSIPTEFSPFQIELLSSIASYASAVIRNAEMYSTEFDIAETLQSSLIGDIPQSISGILFGSRYCTPDDKPRVGGDFYDVFRLPNGKIGIVIADVSGKGLESAIHTAMCKYMLRSFAFQRPDSPASAFENVNNALYHFAGSRFFVTAFYAVLDPDTGIITYANAGHPPPIMMTHGGRMLTMLYKTGAPLGFDDDIEYAEKTVKLDVGCGLFMYTDGIIEARVKTKMLDIEGLQNMLFRLAMSPPQILVESVCDYVYAYCEGKLRDDVAVVAFVRTEASENILMEPEEQISATGA